MFRRLIGFVSARKVETGLLLLSAAITALTFGFTRDDSGLLWIGAIVWLFGSVFLSEGLWQTDFLTTNFLDFLFGCSALGTLFAFLVFIRLRRDWQLVIVGLGCFWLANRALGIKTRPTKPHYATPRLLLQAEIASALGSMQGMQFAVGFDSLHESSDVYDVVMTLSRVLSDDGKTRVETHYPNGSIAFGSEATSEIHGVVVVGPATRPGFDVSVLIERQIPTVCRKRFEAPRSPDLINLIISGLHEIVFA
jgi:hypothetical protein